ncbi:Protease PrtS precursor [Rathayibacter tanaceti]|uniref:Neutral metalloproteinase n=4 Tax=Rathayibacter tanaceti TaxID=1671680 RepID=A0A166H6Q9_9MICO|nr:Protease PrtS precursor [Rathayibacter tanaceti]
MAIDEAYDGLGAMSAFLQEAYGRDSIDDAWLPLNATVHFGDDYDNAFWDGSRMVFGDGDGQVFRRFTVSRSVIGHELAHGITEYTANLVYRGQSGALNESVSDVFGALLEQFGAGQSATEASWLIGEGLFTDEVQGTALRSMIAPGTAYDDDVLGSDPQPGSMADYVDTEDDNGGVHINSGIPNRAFAVAATALGGGRLGTRRAGLVRRAHRRGAHRDRGLRGLRRPHRRGRGRPLRLALRGRGGGPPGLGDGGSDAAGMSALHCATAAGSIARMDVIVSRSGGFAGLRRVWRVDVEQQPDERAWRELLGSLPWDDADGDSPGRPDRFVYEIRVQTHRVRLGESELDGAWRELVDRVKKAQPR